MKRKLIGAVIAVILLICAGSARAQYSLTDIVRLVSPESEISEAIVFEDDAALVSHIKSSWKSRAGRKKAGTDMHGNTLDNRFYLYRSTLTPQQQAAYDELTEALYAYQDSVPISSPLAISEAGLVINSVLYDHPDIFWLAPGYNLRAKHDGTVTSYELDFNATARDFDASISVVENSVRPLLAFVSQLPTDADKVKAVHDYIDYITTYVDGCQYNQSAYCVLANGEAVCAGYAKAFQYCMQKLGVPTSYIVGWVIDKDGNQESHAWNLVELEGAYYAVDTTMDDLPSEAPRENDYDYFMFNEQDSGLHHTRDDVSGRLPQSNGAKYSFTEYYKSDKQMTDFTGYQSRGSVYLGATSPLELVSENGTSYLTGYNASTTSTISVSSVLDEFDMDPGTHVKREVRAADGYTKAENERIGTGDEVVFDSVSGPLLRATIVMKGDVTGSGALTVTQLVEMAHALRSGSFAGEPYLKAGDFNGNGKLDLTDIIRVAQSIGGNKDGAPVESEILPGLYADIVEDPITGSKRADVLYVSQTPLQKENSSLQFSPEWLNVDSLMNANATVNGNTASYVVKLANEPTAREGTIEFTATTATMHLADGTEKTFQWVREDRWELTNEELGQVATALDVPSGLDVTYMMGASRGVWPGYSTEEERYYIHVRVIHDDRIIAYTYVDPVTLEMMRTVYKYND